VTITRREMCILLPGLLPAAAALNSFAEADTSLPSANYPYDKLPVHSEMWLIREGTVDLTVNGTSYRLGPGSVGFVHSNDEHGIRNAGSTPASYFVVAMGPGADA
jgi:mannose-6-phosphate isomerase-like protein (cupin superfamily)